MADQIEHTSSNGIAEMDDDVSPNKKIDPIKFYGLLYIDDRHGDHLNLKNKTLSPEEYYVKCAANLAKSALRAGENFTLITNAETKIGNILKKFNLPAINMIQMEFISRVPAGTRFFQAHHKLDVFKAFNTGHLGKRVGLLDLDMVFLRHFSSALAPDGIHVYDITDQVSAADAHLQISDLEKVLRPAANQHTTKSRRWYGGEFIISSPQGFTALCEIIERLMPNYIDHISTLSHVGDETIVSAALNTLQHRGAVLHDQGAAGTISRWWSSRTGWQQPPFSAVKDRAILHLPGDKPFLAVSADQQPQPFLAGYQNYLRSRLLARRLLTPVLNAAKREKKYAARL